MGDVERIESERKKRNFALNVMYVRVYSTIFDTGKEKEKKSWKLNTTQALGCVLARKGWKIMWLGLLIARPALFVDLFLFQLLFNIPVRMR